MPNEQMFYEKRKEFDNYLHTIRMQLPHLTGTKDGFEFKCSNERFACLYETHFSPINVGHTEIVSFLSEIQFP